MAFKCEPFSALDSQTLFAIMRERVDVFVVEQACPYPELDDVDIADATRHLYSLNRQTVNAYARCYEKDAHYSAIGRVLVAQSQRSSGLGKELVSQAIACCRTHWPSRDIYIGAQTYLLNFYRSFGFECVGEEYLEDGIPHQDMILKQ